MSGNFWSSGGLSCTSFRCSVFWCFEKMFEVLNFTAPTPPARRIRPWSFRKEVGVRGRGVLLGLS